MAQYIFFLLYVPWALEYVSVGMQCSMCISQIRLVTHVIQILVATLNQAEIGEINCNIFYLTHPKCYHFSV